MISNWASGHHAKLAGPSSVYQGQHSERLGDNAPSRPGVRGNGGQKPRPRCGVYTGR